MDRQMEFDLKRAGVDVESVLERCMGNEELFFRLMYKFADDGNFAEFAEGLKEKDAKKAFRAVHTLKGICGNLGFVRLLSYVGKMTEILREEDLVKAEGFFPELEKEYQSLLRLLEEIRGQRQA